MNRSHVINLGLIAGLFSLQFALWAGDKNVFDLYHQNKLISSLHQEIDELTTRNDQFLAEVLDLKSGGQAVETIARQELGYIGEGEVFYQIIKR